MNTQKKIDFERLGYDTMLETRDYSRAVRICGLEIYAFSDQLQPQLSSLDSELQRINGQKQALCSFLYDRALPANDAKMLAQSLSIWIVLLLLVICSLASIAGHATTFYLFGFGILISVVLGITLTGVAAAIGHHAFSRLSRFKIIEFVAISAAFALCFSGLLQMAQARGDMAERLLSVQSSSTSSFVDDSSAPSPSGADPNTDSSLQQKVRTCIGDASAKVMLAADLVLGILLCAFLKLRENEDIVAWQQLKKLTANCTVLRRKSGELTAQIETAKKRCMAGILKAENLQRRKHIPYHQVLPAVLAVLLMVSSIGVAAQTKIDRYEAILIDVSGSIGQSGANGELFHEYLNAAKKLLGTEPPRSRVWVLLITTDSFGGVRPLLGGWTPDVQGVFTEDLDRARSQLASSFEKKASGLVPIASGTDIFGALSNVKTLFESGSGDQHASKEIWILSDMMSETSTFLMPALLPIGPDQMLQSAKANGLVLSLAGYRVHAIGAATRGLTPQAWSTIKTFWQEYFSSTEAQLISYSSRCGADR